MPPSWPNILFGYSSNFVHAFRKRVSEDLQEGVLTGVITQTPGMLAAQELSW
jgi:uncharacterized transporter YbjL